MKAIKLCYDDPDIFGTKATLDRCDFVQNHFESFMQMYKTQGSTFWLRLLMSFKSYIEKKFACSHKWRAILINHFQFIKVLNYMYISVHKKLLEGSNTSVKKFINNLIVLAKNSPSYLKLDIIKWTVHLQSSKQLQTVFQNLFGLPDPSEYNGFTAFVYTIYANFFCAICAVFEQWHSASDLSDEELKKIDTKIIYWLPNIDTENKKIKPMCFEKYISSYWKEDLQKMLLTDNVHNYFSAHKKSGCCDKFDKEKNIFNLFHFSAKNDINLMKVICEEMGIDSPDDHLQTITDVSLKDLCILKPQVEFCNKHDNCRIRICHDSGCPEPFTCNGTTPCTSTCEVNLQNKEKQEKKNGKFWKNVSVEVFDIDSNKRDVSTLAESYERDIETYLHCRGVIDLDFPLSMLKNYSYCVTEWHNLDYNHRKVECLNRLRKKLSQKNPSNSLHINRDALKQTFYRETLFDGAREKMIALEAHYCSSKHVFKCAGDCFLRDIYTVAVNSSDAFGRVVFLSKTSFSIPPVLTAEPANNNTCVKKIDSRKKSDSKKSTKINITEKKTDHCEDLLSSGCNDIIDHSASNNAKASSNKKSCKRKSYIQDGEIFEIIDDEQDDSDITEYADHDEVDEILKLIGFSDHKKDDQKMEIINHEEMPKEELNSPNTNYSPSNDEDKDVDNFLKLIGVKETATTETARNKNFPESSEDKHISETVKCDKKIKLRVCAYCQKKETVRKTFKRCSKCKEENFPVHRYYCSRECLIEDWTESHQEEHLKLKMST